MLQNQPYLHVRNKMAKNKRQTVVLDNCALQNLHENWIKPHRSSYEISSRYDILISYPLIEKIACIPENQLEKRRIYAGSALKMLESEAPIYPGKISLGEVRHALGLQPDFKYLSDSAEYKIMLQQLCRNTMVVQKIAMAARAQREHEKRTFVQVWRKSRQRFRNVPVNGAPNLPNDWNIALSTWETNGTVHNSIREWLETNSKSPRISEPVPPLKDIRKLNYKNLRCTSVAIQYYLALNWRHFYASKSKGGIIMGSSFYDFLYTHYAGLADIFVTDDEDMKKIMDNYITVPHAEVITTDEFIKRL